MLPIKRPGRNGTADHAKIERLRVEGIASDEWHRSMDRLGDFGESQFRELFPGGNTLLVPSTDLVVGL